MTNLRPFQIALLATFGILAIVAIYLVKIYQPPTNQEDSYGDQVIVWGTLDQATMNSVISQITLQEPAFSNVKYFYIDERSFDEELVNAVAENRSPDLIMLKSDRLVKHRAKLIPITFETISKRDFKDTFVEGSEIFMMNNGIYAIPFAIDPLVMYWNRDLFASGGLAEPPRSWEALVSNVVPSLTKRDTSRNILQSAVALGEYRNVQNAKAILMSLAMQSGSQMVTETDRGYLVAIDKSSTQNNRPPLDATLQFYTDFSNSASPLYTWNRAQPSDKNAFLSEDLAVYFGLGSEAENIANKNPNLNFDIAIFPQGATASIKRTYGDIYGFAIPNAAFNKQGAYNAANKFSSEEFSTLLTSMLRMSSPRRSIVALGDPSPYRQVVLQSALISRAWLDPDPVASDEIFSVMVEDVVSNRSRVSSAVIDAVRKLTFEY